MPLRTWAFFLTLFLILPVLGLFSQEEMPPEESPEAPPIESEWIDYDTTLYSRGDKTFTITLGTIFPTVFRGAVYNNNHNLSLGGTGSLSFNYFFGPHVFFGGEFSGMFSATKGENMFYMIPFGFRIGYQFLFQRFEFPLSVMFGAAPQRKLEETYFGLILKPGAAAFWRFSPDWSFGLNSVWWFVPQWPKSQYGTRHNTYGNFLELTISARYHF